jgi:hypothetical protein
MIYLSSFARLPLVFIFALRSLRNSTKGNRCNCAREWFTHRDFFRHGVIFSQVLLVLAIAAGQVSPTIIVGEQRP